MGREHPARRLILGAFGIVAVVIVLLAGAAAYISYAPHLLLNPITRYLYPERDAARGHRVSLVPDIFQAGATRKEVIAALQEAGFEIFDNPTLARELRVTDIFYLAAGGNIACGWEFFLFLTFDDSQRLLKAENERRSGCL